ncbi:class I poly(R)-hydroxyalkanoic acid synthase [Cedecea sp. NFIX57]|uniref:class I poly(R)-hydroxyalkanoic acid synthase n=1 Tax=Cedecea sp. NFIX57 TaxID=1566286 RepID=UPI000A1CD81A|nr:class I poly(R)-hydroxyalkanoic acid synthase [Cedecea sp. NFIX57]
MIGTLMLNYIDALIRISKGGADDNPHSPGGILSPILNKLYEINMGDLSAAMALQFQMSEGMNERWQVWWQRQSELMSGAGYTDKEQLFSAPEWNNADAYTCIKDHYLYISQLIENSVSLLQCQDKTLNMRLKFFSRQFLSALSPANFIFSNPEVAALTAKTQGENLIAGMNNLLEDARCSNEVLNVRQVSKTAFMPGKNLATTPGDVVFRNEICEIIQYRPLTKMVEHTPLLIIPPLINKFYILDLNETKSMVRWLLEQGHCVFMLSWKNPDHSQQNTNFENYVLNGVVKAVSVVESITGSDQVNAVGYCLGGTLLAASVAYYAARRMKKHIKSATYLATIIDFSMPGELEVFCDPQLIAVIDEQNRQRGYMDGRQLNVTFNLLRENTLYWNYYVDRYLKGKSLSSFDLLYWSSDSTNMTAACWYDIVQGFYLENRLVQPRSCKIGGVYIDITRVDIPAYFVATQEDHIALWQGVYEGARYFKEHATFVLGKSGHVAGIINPPAKGKYGYWENSQPSECPDQWLSNAREHAGSWWEHWGRWLKATEKKEPVTAYATGNELHPVLGAAPGEYVMEKLV